MQVLSQWKVLNIEADVTNGWSQAVVGNSALVEIWNHRHLKIISPNLKYILSLDPCHKSSLASHKFQVLKLNFSRDLSPVSWL